jgi:hypothetical protein
MVSHLEMIEMMTITFYSTLLIIQEMEIVGIPACHKTEHHAKTTQDRSIHFRSKAHAETQRARCTVHSTAIQSLLQTSKQVCHERISS